MLLIINGIKVEEAVLNGAARDCQLLAIFQGICQKEEKNHFTKLFLLLKETIFEKRHPLEIAEKAPYFESKNYSSSDVTRPTELFKCDIIICFYYCASNISLEQVVTDITVHKGIAFE